MNNNLLFLQKQKYALPNLKQDGKESCQIMPKTTLWLFYHTRMQAFYVLAHKTDYFGELYMIFLKKQAFIKKINPPPPKS